MSWTDGKPYLVMEDDLTRPWSGAKDGRNFRCQLCGRFFEVGDLLVFIFGSRSRAGNFLACSDETGPTHGDRETMLSLLEADWQEVLRGRFWWALPHQQRPPRPGAKRDSRADRWD